MGKVKQIQIKNPKLSFLQWHNQSQKFQIKLAKNWQKVLQWDWYLLHWIHHNYKNDDCENIHCVNPLYLLILVQVDIFFKKMEINTWFLMILLMKTKGY